MKEVDEFLSYFMKQQVFKDKLNSEFNFTPPVTLAYALERLVILHCKLWMLEDQVRDLSLSNEEIGILKRKIDALNGIQRPRIVDAIGEIFAKAVKEGNEALVRESNLKDYKAR